MKPICIDLFCGIGGWAEGFLAVGFDVIGYDIVNFGRYPAQLVLQDVKTIDGRRFSGCNCIVASPPCQEFSKWNLAMFYPNPPIPDLTLFRECFRIANEAKLPLIIENVSGARYFVGQSSLHYGPFYLWGDGLPPNIPKWNGVSLKGMFDFRKVVNKPEEKAKIPFELSFMIAKYRLNPVQGNLF